MTPRFTRLPAPAYCPEPDPSYPYNEGREVSRVARLMGLSLQPWQRLAVNRATQWRPGVNALGKTVRSYKYGRILITVPRQSGKTTLTAPLQLHRLLIRPNSFAMYTAQTGADAGTRVKEMVKAIQGSPAGRLIKPRFSNGSEGFEILETGSYLTRFSPTLSSVHGGHPHLVTLDEIWKYSLTLGEGLIGAISPSQVSIRQESQIWMVSTKGTAKSEFMNSLIDTGRANEDPRLCFIEWSMPDDADPYDPSVWRQFHPALGNTITEDDLAADMGLPYAEWMRGYMNVVTAADNPLIPLEDFDHLAGDPIAHVSLNDVSIAYEAAPMGQCGAVVAAWKDLDGVSVVRVVRQGPGTAWMPSYLAALARQYPGMKIYADDGGPTRRITDTLKERDDFEDERLTTLSIADRMVADGNLLTALLETGNLRHDGAQVLRLAVANAVTRDFNGTARLDRDRSTAPIPSLIAASCALFGADHDRESFVALA